MNTATLCPNWYSQIIFKKGDGKYLEKCEGKYLENTYRLNTATLRPNWYSQTNLRLTRAQLETCLRVASGIHSSIEFLIIQIYFCSKYIRDIGEARLNYFYLVKDIDAGRPKSGQNIFGFKDRYSLWPRQTFALFPIPIHSLLVHCFSFRN